MKNRRGKSFKAITWMLTLSMVLLWTACMGCMTYMRAEQILSNGVNWRNWDAVGTINLNEQDSAADFEYDVLTQLDLSIAGPNFATDATPSQTAMMVVDSKGEVRWHSQDFLLFNYIWEENWIKGEYESAGWAWIDLEEDEGLTNGLSKLLPTYIWFATLRITGYFEGNRIIPVKVDYTMSFDNEGWWKDGYWKEIYVREADPEKELVTVCTDSLRYCDFLQDSQIWYQGVRYDNVRSLLQESRDREGIRNVMQRVRFDQHQLTGIGADGEREEYTVFKVVVYYPLLGAMNELKFVYLGTFGVLAVFLLVSLRIIYKKLIRPLNKLNLGFYTWVRSEGTWVEPEQLGQRLLDLDRNLRDRNDLLRKKDNEISQLKQKMEYAKKNEENRRQMVSGIAHELKTPLAIISGYAEGLQAHIAEEKREQYLANILSETKRMDALVMQMLELSRLEAGKVTLARDAFDLSAMIQDVFDKLDMEIQRKSLHVEMDLGFNKPLYADEGRMEQIVRNLVSNAVRYTPQGGSIRVITQWAFARMELRIYNEAERFSEEALEKVWEVFYRTDSARNGKGTGLGLAIVKNLVQLHGGTCSVRNLDQGVEFSIIIPQRY